MPFSFTNKSAGDLIRSQDWNAAMAAIAALYDKINGSTGHRHTGSAEDGPQINTGGLADLAVTLQKLAALSVDTSKLIDLAVSTAKLDNGAVTNPKLAANAVGNSNILNGAVDINKMANNSVGTNQIVNGAVNNGKLAANSVGNSQLQDLSVSVQKIVDNSIITQKIADGQVTAAKLASGVAPQIGIALSYCYDGYTAAIPSGFSASECRFFGALDYVYHNVPAGQQSYLYVWISNIDSNGLVSIVNSSNHGYSARARVLAIAKQGGW
jgi:hypothetical protein